MTQATLEHLRQERSELLSQIATLRAKLAPIEQELRRLEQEVLQLKTELRQAQKNRYADDSAAWERECDVA